VCGYVGQDKILRAVVNRVIRAVAIPDKRVTNPLQVVNLPHRGGRDCLYILRSSISTELGC
jgi:hypothetical protein